MAKIAVIFVLIALCSVAMCKRIPREAPVEVNNVLESLNKLVDAAKHFAEDPKTQALFKDLQGNGEKLAKATADQAEKIIGDMKAKAEELIVDGQGNLKKLSEDFAQTAQEVLNKNKKN